MIFLLQLALPNPQHRPAARLEQGRHFFIVLHVPLALFLPVFLMVDRASVSAVVSVPETAVHKHSDLFLWKYEIGMSFYWVISPPACNPILLEYFNQSKFRGLVLFGLNLTHNVRSLFHIENISHGNSPGFKFYAEAGIAFRLQDDFVISLNDAGEHGVSLRLVK